LCGAITETHRSSIDRIIGVHGVFTAHDDVYRLTFPRTDVPPTVDTIPIKTKAYPGVASWAAFTTSSRKEALLMGDFLLLEDEVNPVLSVALDNGLEVTALESRFLFGEPRAMFLSVMGEGRVDELAHAVKKCLESTHRIRAEAGRTPTQVPAAETLNESRISAAKLDRIFGSKGQIKEGIYKAVFGRQTRVHGREIGPQMGVASWATFAGTDERAVVDGDVVMLPAELQPVLKTLRAGNIYIANIGSRMSSTEPGMIFLHFWGTGKAVDLAEVFKRALSRLTASVPGYLLHPDH
jgi:hypothetical protein